MGEHGAMTMSKYHVQWKNAWPRLANNLAEAQKSIAGKGDPKDWTIKPAGPHEVHCAGMYLESFNSTE